MSISNNSLYSCYLRSEVNQFTYEYTIDGIRERNHHLIKSGVFHADESSWSLIIAPIVKNITDGNEYLGVFLNRESGDKAVWTKYTFSLLNWSTNDKFNAKTNSCFFNQNTGLHGQRATNGLVTSGSMNGNGSGGGHQRQRSAGHQWSPLSDNIVLNPGNYEVLRFEFSSPPNPLLSSARDVNRSPVQLSSKSSGIKSYITRDSLFDANNHLVDNNKITIACEICLYTIVDPLESLERFDLNLSQDYSALLKDGKYADVKIIADSQELKAHKAILSARSPVFNAMFSSEMLETRENVIRIDDLSHEVVSELLTFMYSGKVANLSKVSKELLSAADKYELPQLSELCEKHLMSSVSVESAPEILVLSHLHKAAKLKAVVIEFIIANRKDVMKSDNWDLIRNEPYLLEELFTALSNQFDKFGVYVN
ncbi:unnamed protein product [Oppiella nova]|uniref:Uncharacterized protein n=1 Tax=Oppiella nova TaxID=334625 RepID=A0A7R9LYU2_9ACAR|nr:unnamed protein product [Oppiella nova]CAG2168295.1 unnamed protein product [Oppiella nova]